MNYELIYSICRFITIYDYWPFIRNMSFFLICSFLLRGTRARRTPARARRRPTTPPGSSMAISSSRRNRILTSIWSMIAEFDMVSENIIKTLQKNIFWLVFMLFWSFSEECLNKKHIIKIRSVIDESVYPFYKSRHYSPLPILTQSQLSLQILCPKIIPKLSFSFAAFLIHGRLQESWVLASHLCPAECIGPRWP